MKMDYPPLDVSALEERLSPAEIAGLGFSAAVRDIALRMGAALEHNETVSRDEKFGYIFRYDVVEVFEFEDDHTFRPPAVFKGGKHKFITRIAISTKDGEKYFSSSAIIDSTDLK
jgi:hypothetical protein